MCCIGEAAEQLSKLRRRYFAAILYMRRAASNIMEFPIWPEVYRQRARPLPAPLYTHSQQYCSSLIRADGGGGGEAAKYTTGYVSLSHFLSPCIIIIICLSRVFAPREGHK